MAIGTLKFFNAVKGFGFIVPDDGGKDVFVHKTSVELAGIKNLSVGQRLSFEAVTDAKGAVQASGIKPHQQELHPVAANENPTEPFSKTYELRITTRQGQNRGKPRSAIATLGQSDLPESHRNAKTHNQVTAWRRSYDHYCDLARNAGDDLVTREQHWQHAEHFIRMINDSAN